MGSYLIFCRTCSIRVRQSGSAFWKVDKKKAPIFDGILVCWQFYKSCLDARVLNPAAFPPTSDRLAVELDDDAGTPLNDPSLSCAPTPSLLDHSSCQPADESAQQVTPSAAAAAGTEQPQATVEGGAVLDVAAVHDSAMSSAADAGAPQRTGGEGEARSCSEAAVAVAAATETRLRGADDRCCGQLQAAEAPICTGMCRGSTLEFFVLSFMT